MTWNRAAALNARFRRNLLPKMNRSKSSPILPISFRSKACWSWRPKRLQKFRLVFHQMLTIWMYNWKLRIKSSCHRGMQTKNHCFQRSSICRLKQIRLISVKCRRVRLRHLSCNFRISSMLQSTIWIYRNNNHWNSISLSILKSWEIP